MKITSEIKKMILLCSFGAVLLAGIGTISMNNTSVFESSSPGHFLRGIFSDNIPMTLDSVVVSQAVRPVFKGKKNNPVLQIGVFTSGTSAPLTVEEVQINSRGTTDPGSIRKVRVHYTGPSPEFADKNLFAETATLNGQQILEGNQALQQGANYFWISYELDDNTTLSEKIDAHCEKIIISGEEVVPERPAKEQVLKTGLILRNQGEVGVDTYRIPGLVTTNEGTLIAVYDVRYNSSADLQGDIDVGISRSSDGGESWEPMQIIMDMDEWGGLPEDQNGIGDPSILVDDETGTIWVAALWTHGMPGQRAWNASRPGLEPDETGQFMLAKSDDDGKTWSDPINITKQIKKPEWQLLLQGPGKGIAMSDGTLVFPAQFKDADRMPYSTIIYSKDHGKSWQIGTGAKSNTTEAQVVELSDGSLMLNMRDNRGGSRSVYTTNDLGKTWHKHPTSRKALIEPVCMASLIRFPSPEKNSKKHWLMFSNPNSTEVRKDMTIKLSMNDGLTWPEKHQILLNENQGYGYSCMTVIDGQTVGILYEGVKELYFQKVSLHELIGE